MQNSGVNIIAIVQARMGSTRLPNKAMLYLHGFPIIDWVFHRIKKSRKIDSIIFAIPNGRKDDVLDYYLQTQHADVFRGSEDDVLDRFYQAAIKMNATHIVRICADNPLISAQQLDDLIAYYFNNKCDYAYNHIPKNNLYPDGLGAEICSRDILEQIHRESCKKEHREHIFTYIWENQHKFKIQTFDPVDLKLRHPEIKLDVDNYQDYLNFLSWPIHIEMSDIDIIEALTKDKSI